MLRLFRTTVGNLDLSRPAGVIDARQEENWRLLARGSGTDTIVSIVPDLASVIAAVSG